MILIVDDDRTVLLLIKEILWPLDPDIQAAGSAKEALALARDRVPNLIISDIVMGELDGFWFLKKYKETHPYRHTPFIFLSALNTDRDEIKGLNLGADEYVRKPINKELLMAKVKAILRMQRKQLTANFEGTLDDYSPRKIFAFCKDIKLTGAVLLNNDQDEMIWTFKSGRLVADGGVDEEMILQSADGIAKGRFQIIAHPPSFDRLGEPGRNNPSEQLSIPTGIFSSVKTGSHQILIQTEVTGSPDFQIVTTIHSGGKTLNKTTRQGDAAWTFDRWRGAIREHHNEVSQDLKRRLAKQAK